MSPVCTPKTTTPKSFLETVLLPVFREQLPQRSGGKEVAALLKPDDDGLWGIIGIYRDEFILDVDFECLDDNRAILTFRLRLGAFFEDLQQALNSIGPFVHNSRFQIEFGPRLVSSQIVTLRSELFIHASDTDMAKARALHMISLATDLHWFCEFHLPSRLGAPASQQLEETLEKEQFHPVPIAERLETGLEGFGAGDPPELLIVFAMMLGRWDDLLTIIDRHPGSTLSEECVAIRALALHQLERHEEAIQAAREAGMLDSQCESDTSLSSSCLMSLIASDEEIEALRLLGPPCDGEPGIYDLLRGVARHVTGDDAGAKETMTRYLSRYPGDLAALRLYQKEMG